MRLFTLLLVFSPTVVAAESRPNIVLFMCDDLGYEGFGCYGSLTYKTPNLDRLAASGMRFRHCYSQPICTPSRVKIMTGKGNWRNYQRFGLLGRKQVTFANVLRNAGYETCIAGKWQLGGDSEAVRQFGFNKHCLWHLDGRQSRYWNPRIVKDGKLQSGLKDKFGPDVCCDYVTSFIRGQASGEKPFLVYYPMMLPHWPFIPTPDSPEGGSRQRLGKYDGKKGGVEYFDDMVAYLDKIVGRIVKSLDDTKQRKNTLVLFTCDNGCATNITSKIRHNGNTRTIRGGKGSLTDAGTRVALIANWPGTIAAGKVTDALVDFSDVLPTLLDVAGAKKPADLKVDGFSFLPVLRGEKPTVRKSIVIHYARNGVPKDPGKEKQRANLKAKQQKAIRAKKMGRFARTIRYKLYSDGRFYKIGDPEESTAAKPMGEAKKVADELKDALEALPAWKWWR